MTEQELFTIAKAQGLLHKNHDFRVEHPLFGSSQPILVSYMRASNGSGMLYMFELTVKAGHDRDTIRKSTDGVPLHEIPASYFYRFLNDSKKQWDAKYMELNAEKIQESGNVLKEELNKLAIEVL